MSLLSNGGALWQGAACASSTATVEFGLLTARRREQQLSRQIRLQLQKVKDMLAHIPAQEIIPHAWVVETNLFAGQINQQWWFQRFSLSMCGEQTPTHSLILLHRQVPISDTECMDSLILVQYGMQGVQVQCDVDPASLQLAQLSELLLNAQRITPRTWGEFHEHLKFMINQPRDIDKAYPVHFVPGDYHLTTNNCHVFTTLLQQWLWPDVQQPSLNQQGEVLRGRMHHIARGGLILYVLARNAGH